MAKLGRVLEIAIGLVFVFSAAVKAWDVEGFVVQVAAYRVLTNPDWIQAAAYGTVVVEALLGALFLVRAAAPLMVYGAAGLLTMIYTGLIAYAWPKDCGCLGAVIPMGPVESIAKNVVLLTLMAVAYAGIRLHIGIAKMTPSSQAMAVGGLLTVAALGIFDAATQPESTIAPSLGSVDASRPFAQFQFTLDDVDTDLGQGEYLLAMLNAECEHCKASVPGLNILAADDSLPPMIALMMGNNDTLDEFILETLPEFPTQLIDKFEFLDLIEKAPPQLNFDRDGKLVTSWTWDEDVPSSDLIRSELETKP